MKLIDDAGKVWHRLWSVRLALAAALASAADSGWEAHVSGQPRLVSLATFAMSLGAALSRVVAQPKLKEPSDG